VFKGSLVALTTPFDSNNRVDYASLKGLIDFHVNEGTDGLVIAGTTGEAATLSKSEHEELIARAVDIVNGRMPVIAGTGSNSTQQTIDLSLAVGKSGIDAYLVVVPYYNKPVQEGMFQHFSAIADAVEKPIMMYNVPGRTVADMQAETVARLAKHDNIFGIKEATGDIRLCKLVAAGEHAQARALDDSLQALNDALFIESDPIPVKWALSQMGLIPPNLRLPLTQFANQYHDQMRAALGAAGVNLEDAA
jgi:4-hydroxy-tetrahydrodipicolinate synthase